MIKIFGKVHYHWQPDLSILVIYWSIAVIPVFIGLALMYESSSVPTLVLFSFFLFMVLLAIGVHRYFTIYEDGILRIITANPFTPIKVKIDSIEKVESSSFLMMVRAVGHSVCVNGRKNTLSMRLP